MLTSLLKTQSRVQRELESNNGNRRDISKRNREVKAVGSLQTVNGFSYATNNKNIASHWNFTTLAERMKEVKYYVKDKFKGSKNNY